LNARANREDEIAKLTGFLETTLAELRGMSAVELEKHTDVVIARRRQRRILRKPTGKQAS
jgi:hypothetical protein